MLMSLSDTSQQGVSKLIARVFFFMFHRIMIILCPPPVDISLDGNNTGPRLNLHSHTLLQCIGLSLVTSKQTHLSSFADSFQKSV